jgi:hypothetical protein
VYRLPWHPTGTGPYRLLLTVDSGEESLLQGIKEFDVVAPTPVGASLTKAAQ